MATEQPVQVTLVELSRHNTKDDCWLAVHQKVWDVTDFVDEHPGGADSEYMVGVLTHQATSRVPSPPS